MINEVVSLGFGTCGTEQMLEIYKGLAKEHCIGKNGKAMQRLYRPKKFQHDPTVLLDQNEDGSFEEPDVSYKQKGIHQVYFEEVKENHFRPRSLLVDSEQALLDKVYESGLSFSPDQLKVVGGGRQHTYAKALYKTADMEADQIMDMIRTKVELCDNLRGFDIFGNLEGGLCSGLFTNIVQ